MIDHDRTIQSHLLDAKEQILGSIENDRGAELSELEYLSLELREEKQKRRVNSMPFLGMSLVIIVFSIPANTLLAQIFGSVAGMSLFFVACAIIFKHTQTIRELTQKIAELNDAT